MKLSLFIVTIFVVLHFSESLYSDRKNPCQKEGDICSLHKDCCKTLGCQEVGREFRCQKCTFPGEKCNTDRECCTHSECSDDGKCKVIPESVVFYKKPEGFP